MKAIGFGAALMGLVLAGGLNAQEVLQLRDATAG